MEKEVKLILLAGERSGCGKTSAAIALTMALTEAGKSVCCFKCGPDYIDPGFHVAAGGKRGGNPDCYLLGEEGIRYLVSRRSIGCDIALIEGVMGYYDGIGGTDRAGTYEVAKALGACVIMVMDCAGSALTAVARLKGLMEFRKDPLIRGVIFNRLSGKLYPELVPECEALGVRCLGYIENDKDAHLEERHLGLVTAQEAEGLAGRLSALRKAASIDICGLEKIASYVNPNKVASPVGEALMSSKPDGYPDQRSGSESERVSVIPTYPGGRYKGLKTGVARDSAFSFSYDENIELLEEMGSEVVYFSPLSDVSLPEGISGIIFPGGYPEVYAEKLSENRGMLDSVKAAFHQGMPIIAECGGFMYLHRSISGPGGEEYPMAGVIDGTCRFTSRLQHFGYQELHILKDNPLLPAGAVVRAHEFHRSVSDAVCDGAVAVKAGREDEKWEATVAGDNLFAGFSHIHFYSDPAMAVRFLDHCIKFTEKCQI